MDSIAGGVSRLSISESPAMARIPQARDLDDEGHQALDKTVLKIFNLHVKFNQDPDWVSLLLVIVNNDTRLSTLSAEGANELLKRESSLMAVLQKGWVDRSFREVRRLDLLWNHKKSALSAGYKSTLHEAAAIEGAWTSPFRGRGAELFRFGLDRMNNDRGDRLYANFVPIIQSSGMGKSRLVDETAKLIFTIPFCFRSESDGYPKADIAPRRFFQIRANETFEIFFDRCLLFFEKLFVAVTAEVQQLPTTNETLPRQWHGHLKNGNRERLYAKVVTTTENSLDSDRRRHYPSKRASTGSQTKTDTDNSYEEDTEEPGHSVLSGSATSKSSIDRADAEHPEQDTRPVFQAAKALIDVIGSRAKEADRPDNLRPVRLLIYIDESHEMTTDPQTLPDDGRNAYQTLCSSLNALLKLDLFFVFLSTNSNLREYSPSYRTFWSKRGRNSTLAYVQTPYTELPFDIWKKDQLVTEGRHTVSDVCSVKFMVRFGRPLWWALWEAGDREVQDGIIQLAMVKLAARTVGNYETNSFLAALSVRLMLDFEPRRIRATEMENLMVAGHLRVANVIPAHREYVISSTPSEPIVAEAAAQVLRGQNMVDILARNVRDGLIEKGQRGELVARLLLTLAHDQALENMKIPHKANQGQLEKLYTSPILVITFFRALFSQEYVDKLLRRRADNSSAGLTFEEAFTDAYVMFTHFGKAADDWCMSHAFMFMALCRNMAISCREGMEYADLCIPIHFGGGALLSRNTTSAILVSIKDKVDAMGSNRTFVDVNKMAFTQDGTSRPLIILVLQLGVQAKGAFIPIKITKKPREPGLLATPERRGRGGTSIPQTPVAFELPRNVEPTDERTTTRSMGKNKGLACYTIDVRGCSSKIFNVMKVEDKPLFDDLLASRNFLSEHSRQDTDHLSAVLAQKPVWTRGPECCSWAELTAKPPDQPKEEAADEDNIVFGSDEDAVE